jgi:hypothetical protein
MNAGSGERDAALVRLVEELKEALDDPRRDEWGGYPWEHLGDAERDVRKLLTALDRLLVENERLDDAIRDALDFLTGWNGQGKVDSDVAKDILDAALSPARADSEKGGS